MPDDLSYYVADGFGVTAYQPDTPNTLPHELQVYWPQLAPTDVHGRATGAARNCIGSASFSQPATSTS
jgi:hypothetical protein